MIRVDSLTGFVRQLIPIRLRRSRSCGAFLSAMLREMDSGLRASQDDMDVLLNELQYTSQVQAIKDLVMQRYDDRVQVADVNENGNLVLFAAEAGETHDYRQFAAADGAGERLMVYSDAMTDAGCGFTVYVSSGEDKGEVGAFIRRYVLLGINFKVTDI